jgi:hypothetical protein
MRIPKAIRRRFGRRARFSARRARRGVALFLSLFFVAGVGALAMSAIYLTANATLLSKTYEHEDDLKYAAEAALAIGKSNLNYNPASLPSSSYVTMMSGKQLTTADNQPLSGITVNLYAGPSGSTSGQFGRFASVVAQAMDVNGVGFVRRLELTQESFAKFAYWSNSESNNGSPIYFTTGDQLWGPVWSNDTIHVNGAAEFHDEVGTAKNINSNKYGKYDKGYLINQKAITLPTLASLSSLSSLASAGGMSFTAATTGDETTVRTRIEFLAKDLDASGDSAGVNEGFFRVYTATSGNTSWLRGDGWSGTTLPTTTGAALNCGDWHKVAGHTDLKFFPWAVHVQHQSSGHDVATWFDSVVAGGMSGGVTSTNISTVEKEGDSLASTTKYPGVWQHSGVRCYLGGDPHLVAVARTTATGNGHYADTLVHKGGDDTTFTPIDQYGAWKVDTMPVNAAITAVIPSTVANYLFPLYRGYNSNTKGVIYFNGTVGVSGVVGGDVTLYTPNTIVVLDDTRYANDPANGLCIDILGLLSGTNVVVADNALNSPQETKSGTYRSLDDTQDFYLHAVIMALNTSFEVENYDTGPTTTSSCAGSTDGRGCLYLTGGIIQNNRGPVGTSTGSGFLKQYSYDACALSNPPPYFPTTGRFLDNRYYELDPSRFNVTSFYKSLTPH